MSIILPIGIFIIVFIALLKFAPSLFKNNATNNTSRPLFNAKPDKQVPNDKLIIIAGITYEDVKKAIASFCNMYNQKDWAALPRLIKLASDKFAITFPYDTEFRILFFW
ncbi:hypothetical protein [Mucilaginibacter flavus]|uniref:hypothetical protein n=1 Tax=Mucilaginibacter flavus TaxID=931504 RepID=UPI0025B3BAD8|nr:hypothetical protein [Mucilaginibacter flavus]MDN3580813.1 hypothetical protein [Mucilaginibacter flavus]